MEWIVISSFCCQWQDTTSRLWKLENRD